MSHFQPRESKADEWIERLRTASTRDSALAAVLDLRDDAYDFPNEWQRLTAVRLLDVLADQLEETTEDALDWGQFGTLVGGALSVARSDTGSNWDA